MFLILAYLQSKLKMFLLFDLDFNSCWFICVLVDNVREILFCTSIYGKRFK